MDEDNRSASVQEVVCVCVCVCVVACVERPCMATQNDRCLQLYVQLLISCLARSRHDPLKAA